MHGEKSFSFPASEKKNQFCVWILNPRSMDEINKFQLIIQTLYPDPITILKFLFMVQIHRGKWCNLFYLFQDLFSLQKKFLAGIMIIKSETTS